MFPSRRLHTRYIGDWSSDVCSSDLARGDAHLAGKASAISTRGEGAEDIGLHEIAGSVNGAIDVALRREVNDGARGVPFRSEERRVGKVGSTRCRQYLQYKLYATTIG